jgi:tetratricopeptide (TPR) repeat protein
MLSGCAYYNTFYNARKAFDEAEARREASGSATSASRRSGGNLYDKAIKKASRVLAFYPDSRWVDDSLLLLGKAFYHKGEYEKSVRKFEELEANFPESDLVEDGRYWRGLALLELGREDEAIAALEALIAVEDSPWRGAVLVALGEVASRRLESEEASGYYRGAIQVSGDKKTKARAYLSLGQELQALGDYEGALPAFRSAWNLKASPALSYEARMQIGACLEDTGDFEGALANYRLLEKDDRWIARLADIRLRIAKCTARWGKTDLALEEYERIPEEHPRTEQAADALYRMGVIHQKGDPDRASEYFDRAAKESASSEGARLAKLKRADLEQLASLRAELADTTKIVSAENLFGLAELFLLRLDQPDSAVAAYRHVAEAFPESDLAPRALYAIACIPEEGFEKPEESKEVLEKLIEKYPDSAAAEAAERKLGRTVSEDVFGEDPAQQAFIAAERLRLSGGATTAVIVRYKEILEQYPESLFAPKSAYTVAWVYENVVEDSARARIEYEQLAERFPGTEFGRIAEKKLELRRRLAERPPEAEPEPTEEHAASVERTGVPAPDQSGEMDTTGLSVPDQTDSTAVEERAAQPEPSDGLTSDQRDSLAEPISEAEPDSAVAHSSEAEQPGILLPEERDSVHAKTEVPRSVLPETKLPTEADTDSLRN